ncbi:MAG: hypothetical protein JWN78_2133 [Bacteroidota bacterium]|nr:hypothetical protein [Bacteroidota bacterium]
MRPVFRNSDLEQKFQKDGYVVIPFLDKGEIQDLKNSYFETLPESGGLIHSDDAGIKDLITYDFTFIDKNSAYKKLVFDVITAKFKSHVDNYLIDYRPIIANYIRKKTNNGEVPLHQNWAFVEERKCTSISIWCPLVDSNESNGTLQVVPGSHKRFGEIRGPMIPWELEKIKDDIIGNCLIPMNISAGEAVILDDSIIHYSAINKTNDLRLAIQLILIPSETNSIHYHMDPSKSTLKVDVLEVDVDFYMEFNPWKKPENFKLLRTINYKPVNMPLEKFKRGLLGKRIDEERKTGILKRIKSVFSNA